MKVKDLIKQLEKCNEDWEVVYWVASDGSYNPSGGVIVGQYFPEKHMFLDESEVCGTKLNALELGA